MKPLRIGVIGAGTNTRLRHLPGLQALPAVEIAVVCNRTAASAKAVAKAFAVPRVATDWRQVVAYPAIDAVVIGTWPDLHAEITLAALAAGKARPDRGADGRQPGRGRADAGGEPPGRPDLVAQIEVPGAPFLDFDSTISDWLARGEARGPARGPPHPNLRRLRRSRALPLPPRLDELCGAGSTSSEFRDLLRKPSGAGSGRIRRRSSADAAVFHRRARGRKGAARARAGAGEPGASSARYPDGSRLVAHFSGVRARGAPRRDPAQRQLRAACGWTWPPTALARGPGRRAGKPRDRPGGSAAGLAGGGGFRDQHPHRRAGPPDGFCHRRRLHAASPACRAARGRWAIPAERCAAENPGAVGRRVGPGTETELVAEETAATTAANGCPSLVMKQTIKHLLPAGALLGCPPRARRALQPHLRLAHAR